MIKNFKDKDPPIMPLKANTLMEKYNIPEGKEVRNKLKLIEEFGLIIIFKFQKKKFKK